MGCGLNKLEKHDEKRPGNIYSTLKRPQVETKTDVSYEYRFLEFTTLSAAELPRSSAVRLASLRDLPAQLLELYQQGFSLAALHPFVQLTPEREKTPLEHIFRAILIKRTERSQKADLHSEDCVLELDCSSSSDHLTDQKTIPEFIKKVQEAASRGLQFVGVVPQYPPPARPAGSSPPMPTASGAADPQDARPASGRERAPPEAEDDGGAPAGTDGGPGDGDPCLPQEPTSAETEVFALFNRPKSPQTSRQYYPVAIPLRVARNGQTVSSLDASWLEHTSDHFRKGGVLADAVLPLGVADDSVRGLADGVFIFEAASAEDSKTIQGYDAIVVEQWTVLEGVEVRTDYVPLLTSLAAYGWRLACVLATPVVKATREGNVSTKQIVFLQRPCLPQRVKKKESKFQWRFSREDAHGRQARRPRAKLGSRGRRRAEEHGRSAEQTPDAAGLGNCALGQPGEEAAPKGTGVPVAAAREELGPSRRPSGSVEGSAAHNGPASPGPAPAGGSADVAGLVAAEDH